MFSIIATILGDICVSNLLSKTPGNIAFSVRGAMQNCCGQTPKTNLNPSQRAYRNYRTALN